MRLIGLLFLVASFLANDGFAVGPSALTWRPRDTEAASPDVTQAADVRRVNVPYEVPFSEAAIFWFGRLTPTENAADARVIYREDELYVRVAAFDRRLWYDKSPSPDELTAWDAVSLFLDTSGNAGEAPDADSYRFEAQLVWWELRDSYQVAFTGDGGDWTSASVPFTTESFWRGNSPNDDVDDRAWGAAFKIPWQSLGLNGPPAGWAPWPRARPGRRWACQPRRHDRARRRP